MFDVYKRSVTRLGGILATVMICAPVLAETSTIRTPPDSALLSISNDGSLHELALANLVASNCNLTDLTKGDAGLLAGTAQMVAQNMGISTDAYFSVYIHQAMAQIASPEGCEQHADATRAMVKTLKDLGGAVLDN